MQKIHVTAFASSLAILIASLHLIIHLGMTVYPSGVKEILEIFLTGIRIDLTAFDQSLLHLSRTTLVEAGTVRILGALLAYLYNTLASTQKNK